MLSFQRLDVYQRAIEFLALVGEIVDDLPKGNSERSDQLVRAAEYVVRNIAEGAGRWSDADSAKHYKIARGEAMECAASLDVMRLRKLVPPQRYDHGIRLLEAIVAHADQDVLTSTSYRPGPRSRPGPRHPPARLPATAWLWLEQN